MTDPIVQSALDRDKPVAAKRVRAIVERLALAERIAKTAKKWAAHDDTLRELLREWEGL